LSGNITQWFGRPSLIQKLNIECPGRVKNIKSRLERFPDEFPITENTKNFGMEPILAIHDADYVTYLQKIYHEWSRALAIPVEY
jgi:acetoin utilization deacetylase AcuC-like enzyme